MKWFWPCTRDLAIGLIGTALGVLWGYDLTVRHDLEAYRRDILDARTAEASADRVHAEAIAAQINLNGNVAISNIERLKKEISVYPGVVDFIPLAPLLEVATLDPGVRFPEIIAQDSLLRTLALQIMLEVRSINSGIANLEEFKRKGAFSGLVFDGSRPSDPQPGDAERRALDIDLLARHRRFVHLAGSFQVRYEALVESK